jgi:hypothetical protein
MDALMLLGGFGSQRTDEPKPEGAPDGLFAPVENQDRAEADFGGQTLSRSIATWLDTHPAAKRSLIAGAALGVAAALRARS